MRPALVALGLLATLPACFDFDSPSSLIDVQLLAVRATPKAIPAGGRAKLDFLLAGPDGIMEAPQAIWALSSDLGTPAIGEVVRDGADWYYRAPDTVPEETTVSVGLGLLVEDEPLAAIKVIGVGMPETPNPTIGPTFIGNGDRTTTVLDDGFVVRVFGDELRVGSSLQPDVGELTSLAWYSTFGEADPIRGSASSFEIDPERSFSSGPVVVVGRDGQGGVAWRIVTIDRDIE